MWTCEYCAQRNPADGRQFLDQMRAELANVLLVMQEQLAPVYDAADGMRAELTKRGWSPAAAEQVAASWLSTALSGAANGGQQ